MTALAQKLKAALSFTRQDFVDAPAYIEGIADLTQYANARLAPLHERLIACVEAADKVTSVANREQAITLNQALASLREVLGE